MGASFVTKTAKRLPLSPTKVSVDLGAWSEYALIILYELCPDPVSPLKVASGQRYAGPDPGIAKLNGDPLPSRTAYGSRRQSLSRDPLVRGFA